MIFGGQTAAGLVAMQTLGAEKGGVHIQTAALHLASTTHTRHHLHGPHDRTFQYLDMATNRVGCGGALGFPVDGNVAGTCEGTVDNCTLEVVAGMFLVTRGLTCR